MDGEVNVVALMRGDEQYLFVFDPTSRTELLRLLGRFAADPELSFTWYDAAILSQKIREMMPADGSKPMPTEAAPALIPASKSNSSEVSKTSSPRFKLP